ncbi:MAG: hypothetical protein U5O69_09595 [Candidatus Competibacteraceae bacterium]|nr:hypothetical protein [Candidatus Competibacteraceae bacterium]
MVVIHALFDVVGVWKVWDYDRLPTIPQNEKGLPMIGKPLEF